MLIINHFEILFLAVKSMHKFSWLNKLFTYNSFDNCKTSHSYYFSLSYINTKKIFQSAYNKY